MHNVPGPTPKKQEPESKRVDKLIERLTLIRQRIASAHQLGMFSVLQQLEFAESEVLAQIREHELMERERKNKKDDRDDGLIV